MPYRLPEARLPKLLQRKQQGWCKVAARCKLEVSMRDEPAVAGERAHLQDDLAFCFQSDGKNNCGLENFSRCGARRARGPAM